MQKGLLPNATVPDFIIKVYLRGSPAEYHRDHTFSETQAVPQALLRPSRTAEPGAQSSAVRQFALCPPAHAGGHAHSAAWKPVYSARAAHPEAA